MIALSLAHLFDRLSSATHLFLTYFAPSLRPDYEKIPEYAPFKIASTRHASGLDSSEFFRDLWRCRLSIVRQFYQGTALRHDGSARGIGVRRIVVDPEFDEEVVYTWDTLCRPLDTYVETLEAAAQRWGGVPFVLDADVTPQAIFTWSSAFNNFEYVSSSLHFEIVMSSLLQFVTYFNRMQSYQVQRIEAWQSHVAANRQLEVFAKSLVDPASDEEDEATIDRNLQRTTTREDLRRGAHDLKLDALLAKWRQHDAELRKDLVDMSMHADAALERAMRHHAAWQLPASTGVRYPPEFNYLGHLRALLHFTIHTNAVDTWELGVPSYGKVRGRREWLLAVTARGHTDVTSYHTKQARHHAWTSLYGQTLLTALQPVAPRWSDALRHIIGDRLRASEASLMFHYAQTCTPANAELLVYVVVKRYARWLQPSQLATVTHWQRRLVHKLRNILQFASTSELDTDMKRLTLMRALALVHTNVPPLYYC